MAEGIAIGADHGGFKLKELLKKYLSKKGHKIIDFGTDSDKSCDYPLIGYQVARSVSKNRFERGILVCKTGIGMAITANKLRNIRAAVCNTVKEAKTSRLHNDTNVLVLAARYVSFGKAKRIANIWLKTKALSGRHRRRVSQIKRLEKRK